MSAVKSNGPIIDPALCRCCRSIKKCRMLTAEYTWMDKKEVYADMIMDCYGILLSHVDEAERDSGVCATCVVRLREAVAFRHQVLQCEELFLRAKLEPSHEAEPDGRYENKLKKLELELKTEPKDYASDHSTGDRDDACAAYSDDDADDNKPLKKEEPKPEEAPKEDVTKSEGSEFGDSSSDSDEPIKRKMKRKAKAKANGTRKKPKIAKKQKPESDHSEVGGPTASAASTNESDVRLHTEIIKIEYTDVVMDIMEEDKETTSGAVKKGKFNYTQKENSEYQLLCEQLKDNEELYFKHYNMSMESFEELFKLLESSIEKEITNYRMPIPSRHRLAVCLRYMKSGDSFKSIAKSDGLGRTSVSKIVNQVSKAIWDVLQPLYLPVPTTDSWIRAELAFREKFNFPNCFGSIGVKHVLNKNHKSKPIHDNKILNIGSVLFVAIADANCNLTMIDIDNYVTKSDNDVLESTSIFRDYIDGETILPPKPLPGNSDPISHVLVGDESVALRPCVLRPFPKTTAPKCPPQLVYNDRLQEARTVDKVFSILLNEWMIFQRPIECSQESVIYLTKAACCLHNFIRSKHGMPKDTESLVQRRIKHNRKLLKAFYPCKPLRQRSTNAGIYTRQAFMAFFNRTDDAATVQTEQYRTEVELTQRNEFPTQDIETERTDTEIKSEPLTDIV